MTTIHLLHESDPEPLEIKLERARRGSGGGLTIHLGDKALSLEADELGEGRGMLRVQGRVLPYRAIIRNRTVQVWLAGRVHTFEIKDRAARRAGAAGSAGAHDQVVAPMPGTILRVDVSSGDRFEAHQPLVIMESMKMETTLSVPHPGIVEQVNCRVGDLVDMGAVLVNVKPEDGDDAG